jgi:hypothetical protein
MPAIYCILCTHFAQLNFIYQVATEHLEKTNPRCETIVNTSLMVQPRRFKVVFIT